MVETKVKCWGANNVGMLGYGDTDHRGDEAGEMGDYLPYIDLGYLESPYSFGVLSNYLIHISFKTFVFVFLGWTSS